MTHEQLGDYLGLSGVHICRTMREFVTTGLIEKHGDGRIRISDMSGLSEVAGLSVEELATQILPDPDCVLTCTRCPSLAS